MAASFAEVEGRTTARASNAAFWALCLRDLKVTFSNLPAFLAQMLLQPLFFLFIFGKVLPELQLSRPGYATLLLPGIVALTVFLTGLQTTSLPLVIEFSFTKEIEDRLLAPLSVGLVGFQKIFVATIRGILAGSIIFPLGWLILGDSLSLSLSLDNFGFLVLVMILGGIAGSAAGLAMGTSVQATQINLIFSLVLTPLLFTGCVYYPWSSLNRLQWFQVITSFNPLTYVSEGLRASLVPDSPHMDQWAIVLGLLVSVGLFSWLGIRGFFKRAVD